MRLVVHKSGWAIGLSTSSLFQWMGGLVVVGVAAELYRQLLQVSHVALNACRHFAEITCCHHVEPAGHGAQLFFHQKAPSEVGSCNPGLIIRLEQLSNDPIWTSFNFNVFFHFDVFSMLMFFNSNDFC